MDKNEQNGTELTDKQLKSIPLTISAKNVNEGVKKAKIGRSTYYTWLSNPQYRKEVESFRKTILCDSISELKQSTQIAVNVLKSLLESKSETIKLRSAKYIIYTVMKYIEIEDIITRLEVLEKRL
jgi:hypothetical protein